MGGGSARLTINGKVTKLVGWNHHTQWPVTAASPNDDQIDADIALLKKGNANLVRGAHYPHDPRWMDRLDEAGILFWSETLGPSVSLANTKDWKYFMKFQLTQLDEMLNNALNHASVYAWGWFNEWDANATDAKWTLKYQSEIIGGDVDVALANEHISAIALWHFYDFKVDNCGSTWPCPWGGQENNTHCTYDHEPPTTFEELASKGPPNCTYIEINGRPGGENHKGSLDFWRR